MLNKAFLMGRLVADPELRHTQNNVAVASFRIAVDRDYKREDGQRDTDFINIVAWRSTAEFVSRYFAKGRMAVVEGRIQVRNYTDNNGNKRTAMEIVADSVYFGDSKKDEGQQGGYYAPPPQAGAGGYTNQGGYAPPPGGYGAPPQQGYGAPPQGGYSQPPGGYGAPPQNAYPLTPGANQFGDLEDDDGELPF